MSKIIYDRQTLDDLGIFLEAFVCECDDPDVFLITREITSVFNAWRRERSGSRAKIITVGHMGRLLSASRVSAVPCWRRDVQERAQGVRGWFWAPEAKPYLN